MNNAEKIIIPSSVFAQLVDDEMILLDTESENYFGLDAVGTVMWQQLVENPLLDVLKSYMLEQYEVEEERLEKDIEIFVKTLVDHQLITLG
ncbi:MAG TPA: PqqD family protein [Epsilonproteobacteria bacterium]|nr:PqqD family protein [Campylobacterota bacterium]